MDELATSLSGLASPQRCMGFRLEKALRLTSEVHNALGEVLMDKEAPAEHLNAARDAAETAAPDAGRVHCGKGVQQTALHHHPHRLAWEILSGGEQLLGLDFGRAPHSG